MFKTMNNSFIHVSEPSDAVGRFYHINLLDSHNSPLRYDFDYPHFMVEETETQQSKITFLRSSS